MSYLIFVSLLALFTISYCEEKLIFAYSYTVSGSHYPKLKIRPWVPTTSATTSAGIRQQFILGSELRNRLITKGKLLDEKFNATQYKVEPLMVDNAVESAYAQVAGFYPVGTGEVIPDKKVNEKALPPNKYDFTEWIKELGPNALNHTYQVMPLLLNGKPYNTFLDPENSCKTLEGYINKHSGKWKENLKGEIKAIAAGFKIKEEEISNLVGRLIL